MLEYKDEKGNWWGEYRGKLRRREKIGPGTVKAKVGKSRQYAVETENHLDQSTLENNGK